MANEKKDAQAQLIDASRLTRWAKGKNATVTLKKP